MTKSRPPSMRGVRDLTARVSQAREQMGDEELIQAASQVQAKLKMFSAYEEELTGRAGATACGGGAAAILACATASSGSSRAIVADDSARAGSTSRMRSQRCARAALPETRSPSARCGRLYFQANPSIPFPQRRP